MQYVKERSHGTRTSSCTEYCLYLGTRIDFFVYGSPDADTGTEREFHHYGAPLNALVTLEAWRIAPVAPNSLYLLEVGVGGMGSFLTNVNATDGAPISIVVLIS